MQEERTTPHTLLPEEPGNDTVEAAASMDEGSAEGQAAPASSDGHKAPLTKPVTEILGIPEWMRGKDGDLESKQVKYTCDPAVASAIHEMAARAKYERDPWKQMPVPTMREAYGTTGNLFARIKQTIGEQTHLSDKDSALLTFWALSTWFQDVLPLAPGLAVSGWAHEGEVVLRTLRAFCYHPILIAGMTSATLNDIDWDRKPTLLISEPALSKRMAALLGTSTCRGYLARRKVDGFLNWRGPASGIDVAALPAHQRLPLAWGRITARGAPVGKGDAEFPEPTLGFSHRMRAPRVQIRVQCVRSAP